MRWLLMQLFFVVFWEKSTRLTCRWKEKHMTTVLVHCNRLRLAVSLEMLVTSLMKGRKVPGSPPPWASKGSPSHLQCRIWRQRFTLQWKAEVSNHTSDRPRVPRVISLPAVDYLVFFLRPRYCSVTVLTVAYMFLNAMQKHLSTILAHAEVCAVTHRTQSHTKLQYRVSDKYCILAAIIH